MRIKARYCWHFFYDENYRTNGVPLARSVDRITNNYLTVVRVHLPASVETSEIYVSKTIRGAFVTIRLEKKQSPSFSHMTFSDGAQVNDVFFRILLL